MNLSNSTTKVKWPADVKVRMLSRWKIIPGKENGIKPETTAMLIAADAADNTVRLFINPAIGWEGNYQELIGEWKQVSDETPLTF